ncbi:MAG: aminotransferase class IV [Candidatus Sumerlaeia bacterium]|nr:aminotransferase class IV [Candidatus Sumerlaeia bacterium]
MPRDLLWLNGQVMDIAEGRLPVEDRATNFGEGIYEVILFYDGRPFLLREHLERWEFSARGIEIVSPGTLPERFDRLCALVEESGHRNAMVYGQLSRGVAKRNHLFPDPAVVPPTEFWFVRPAPVHKAEHYANGVKLVSHPDERWPHCHYKTIALLPNCLAKNRAQRAGGFEALLYREDGTVTECSASNAWCVRGGEVWTHPATNRILAGITRRAIIEEARALGLAVREEAVSLAGFKSADEVFVSSTTMEVMPVSAIDEARIGKGAPGPVTAKLRSALRERVERDCAAAAR